MLPRCKCSCTHR